MQNNKEKTNRGGKRPGSGRKKGPEKVYIYFRVDKARKEEIRKKLEIFIESLD